MKRIKLYFTIIAVVFFANSLAVAQDTTLTVTSAGNVGIGTNNPAFLLDIFGTNYKVRYNSGGNVDVLINRASSSNYGNLQFASGGAMLWAVGLRGVSAADGLYFHDEDAGVTRMMIDGASRNVGIGTLSPQGKLDVNGAIFQRGGELHADYVFEPEYQLESIEDHADFMWKFKHLKAIPKAQVDEHGREIVEVGAHRKGIVEELEKAHIYIEQLHNRIKTLETTLKHLSIRLDGNNQVANCDRVD